MRANCIGYKLMVNYNGVWTLNIIYKQHKQTDCPAQLSYGITTVNWEQPMNFPKCYKH